MLDVTSGLFFVAVLAVSTWYFRRPRNLPPGPWAWPIIGNLLEVSGNREVHHYYTKHAKTYGNIYTLWLGSHPGIVLTGPEMIREAFVKNADYFSDRPDWLQVVKRASEHKGIIWSIHGWKNSRKFALTALKDFGLGKSSLEEKIHEEIVALANEFEKTNGEPVNVQMQLQYTVSNIICSVVFGTRFAYDDAKFLLVMDQFSELFSRNIILSWPNYISGLLAPLAILGAGRVKKSRELLGGVQDFIMGKIKAHEETYDRENIRDFIDLYIQCKKEGSTEFGAVSEQDALRMILDLFAAGTETTSTSLQWFLAYMINFPQVQDKCRQEIYQHVGSNRMPTMKDRDSLIYTNATLQEIQRLGCIATNSLPHTCNKNINIGGYTVPKDAFVTFNIYGTHVDPNYFPEPEEFKPERWIGDDGKFLKNDAFLPFSIGRRVCLGEQLAKMEIFLFTVSLLQRFELKMASELPSLDGILGITLQPKPFQIRAIRA